MPDWAVVTLTVRTGSPAVENMSIAEAEYTNFPSLLQYCTTKYVTTLEKTRKITERIHNTARTCIQDCASENGQRESMSCKKNNL